MQQNRISTEEFKRKLEDFNINNEEEKAEIGFNDQEKEAYYCGYFENSPNLLPNYLPAKLKLLQSIGKSKNIKEKKLLQAKRLYLYTLFENIWFGYLIAYADSQKNVFTIKGKPIEKLYSNHLPSFSSAILHFGTCRDLLSQLLRLFAEQDIVNNFNKLSKTKKGASYLNALSSDAKFLEEGKAFYDDNEFRNFFCPSAQNALVEK